MVSVQHNQLRAAFLAAPKSDRRNLIAQMPDQEVRFQGLRMFVHPRDNITERLIWLTQGPSEPRSLNALIPILKGKRTHIMDIGANCGLYALLLAKHAGPGSQVLAFEPNPKMIERLTTNLALNDCGDRVQIKPCALGGKRGPTDLYLHASNFGQSTLDASATGLRESIQVKMCRLEDHLPNPSDFEVRILKIDVEGWEPKVLLPWLKTAPASALPEAILIETKHAQVWDIDLIVVLKSLGYLTRFKGEGNTLFTRNLKEPMKPAVPNPLRKWKKRVTKWLN